MRIIGRAREQAALSASWERSRQGEPQLVVMWGRRRVGKTYLLTAFAEGRRAVYFTATRQDGEAAQVRRFTERLRESLGPELGDLIPATFADWEEALRFVVQVSVDRELLVVLDEVPRLGSRNGAFADLVSAVWENHVRDQRLMLVLSGSAMAVMEQMLGHEGGLHRRAHLECRLDPFSLLEARPFQPDLPADQFVEAYAACGGYPLHLARWDPARDVDTNLADAAFTPGALLLRDAQDIMSEDLDTRGGYERVLGAMAGGPRRRSRIAGRAQQRIEHTLAFLQRAGYVRRVRSLGDQGSTDPLYEIADDYLAFWFDVLRVDADLVEAGQGRAVASRTAGRRARRVSAVFEEAARAHAQRLVERGEFPADTLVGRWWRDETVEIDALGLAADGPVFVGEAKWSARAISARDLAAVRTKGVHVAPEGAGTVLFWARGTLEADITASDVRVFGPPDLLDE